MSNYQVTIGVEVHIELKTKTKCFSGAANTFAATPNSQTSAIDCGYPGTMPVLNQAVVVAAVKLAHALKMEIDSLLRFDRKNYFYSDLPKGYQITQYYHPFGRDGQLKIVINDQPFLVEFERVHIEEDTAKQIHEGDATFLDYNRAGIPLLELVTKPIFTSSEQVVAYIKALRKLLVALDISDADMSQGSLRCDLNISLKQPDAKVLGTKVEVKNLNSLHNITLAVDDEITRQTKLLDAKTKIVSQTRRFDEKTKQTVLMREKTSIVDYKYFREPNILPIQLDQRWINQIIADMPFLPDQIVNYLKTQYHLSDAEINILLDREDLRLMFELIVKDNNMTKATINFLLGPVLKYLSQNNINNINDTRINYRHLSELIKLISQEKVNNKQSQKILATIFTSNENSPQQLLAIWDVKVISNETEIKPIIEQLFQEHPLRVEEYFNNPVRANKFFMGQIMKITKGQVNPKLAQALIDKVIVGYKK